MIRTLTDADVQVQPQHLRKKREQVLQPYSDDEIRDALATLSSSASAPSQPVADDDPETAFRRPEFHALRQARNEPQLLIRPADPATYDAEIARYFSRLTLVDKLRETRAFTGFTRVLPEDGKTVQDRKAMLWRDADAVSEPWLPAYVVYGEGLYLEFNEPLLQAWEARDDVERRVGPLVTRYEMSQAERGLAARSVTARQILIHTFAHLLMLRLTFECGYGVSSLRERLYLSRDKAQPMAGVLVYTAAGDSEGTMGGLVRMGRPGNLEPVVRRALESATWCSADPICMEIASSGGQGPNSLNLAACHGCALVPETACELFNSFLDRGLLIGDQDNPDLGFFSALLSDGGPTLAV